MPSPMVRDTVLSLRLMQSFVRCTSHEPSSQLAIHDFPELCLKPATLSEDPESTQYLRHVVKGAGAELWRARLGGG